MTKKKAQNKISKSLILTSIIMLSMNVTGCGGGGGSSSTNENDGTLEVETGNTVNENSETNETDSNESDTNSNDADTEDTNEPNTGTTEEDESNGSDQSETEDANTGDVEVDQPVEASLSGVIEVTSEWDSGYNAELLLSNYSLTSFENWVLSCTSKLSVSSIWNAEYQLSGDHLQITPVSWNKTLSSESTITVGFSGAGSLPNEALTQCDLSGLAIEISQVSDVQDTVDPEPENDNDTEQETEEPNQSSTITRSELDAAEAELTSGDLMALVKEAIRTRDNQIVEAVDVAHPGNPENVLRVERLLSESDWDYLFPRRAEEYTYRKFLQAVAKFPAFCGDYTDGRDADAICRKSLATMFAHFTQETGGHTGWWAEEEWRQGLHYIRELGWSEEMANGYGICDPATWQAQTWPCALYPEGHALAGQYKSYFGRGAKQLSYNYNYGPFSLAMFGDVTVLLENPELVADTWLNLASAVFFFVYPQPPKPSMLHVIDGTWQPNESDLSSGLVPGFGVTTQIINGGIECGGNTEHLQSQNRIDYYLNMANYLQVPVSNDEVLGCAGMKQFDSSGAGALAIYWEQSWTKDNACQLVGYQTAFSAFTLGDYAKCVDHYFDVEIIED